MANPDVAERQHLRLCLALHRALATPESDSCFSPYSVASALNLVRMAARGDTAAELEELLGGSTVDFAAQQELFHRAAEPSARGVESNAVVVVSNTLWASDRLRLNSEFAEDLRGVPGAGVANAPFATDPERARQLINADVAATTRNLIPELLASGAVSSNTVASLVNALYLQASWLGPFAEEATAEAEFYAPSGMRSVPMMFQSKLLGYAAVDGWKAVGIPVVGGIEAVVLLPDDSLISQEKDLDERLLGRLLARRKLQPVRLWMPKFVVDTKVELLPALSALGVREMFTPSADLSGLSDDPLLMISAVAHQAVLRIDEYGLEGAAATAAMALVGSARLQEPITITVDRPFLVLVRHQKTGAVYFFARVSEP